MISKRGCGKMKTKSTKGFSYLNRMPFSKSKEKKPTWGMAKVHSVGGLHSTAATALFYRHTIREKAEAGKGDIKYFSSHMGEKPEAEKAGK